MFYVTSDIHLEFHSSIDLICSKIESEIRDTPIASRVLFLCGDIGHPFSESYQEFIKFCSDNFRFVLLITGNHEYYCSYDQNRAMEQIDAHIEYITMNYDNVIFLNRSYYVLEEFNTIVFGTTLWSGIDPKYSRKGINDFTHIVTEKSSEFGGNITLSEYNDLHVDHLNRLINSVAEIANIRESSEYSDYKLIIMTHHLPSFDLIDPQYDGSSINKFFATDLNHIIESFNANPDTTVSHWFCGHTHSRMEKDINGTKIIVNPYGYPHEYDQHSRTVLQSIDISSH